MVLKVWSLKRFSECAPFRHKNMYRLSLIKTWQQFTVGSNIRLIHMINWLGAAFIKWLILTSLIWYFPHVVKVLLCKNKLSNTQTLTKGILSIIFQTFQIYCQHKLFLFWFVFMTAMTKRVLSLKWFLSQYCTHWRIFDQQPSPAAGKSQVHSYSAGVLHSGSRVSDVKWERGGGLR